MQRALEESRRKERQTRDAEDSGSTAAAARAAHRSPPDTREASRGASRRGSGDTAGASPLRYDDLEHRSGSHGSRSGSVASKGSRTRQREEELGTSDRSNRAKTTSESGTTRKENAPSERRRLTPTNGLRSSNSPATRSISTQHPATSGC